VGRLGRRGDSSSNAVDLECKRGTDHEQRVFSVRRWMSVRTGTVPNRCAAGNHDGLPLHGMPTNECQRILSECSHSERSVSSYSRGAAYRRPSRSDRHFFCPYCMSWMFTRPDGFDSIVNVRVTMLDDPRPFPPFIETYTSEKLPWASTPAVRSFEKFPALEEYESLARDYAAHIK
jgi:hypothetical protein